MMNPGDPIEERKRALLARLRGGRGRGEFAGRGLGRGTRGGPPVGIMSMLGAAGERRGGIGQGGLGGAWQGATPEPRHFPTLPPRANPPWGENSMPLQGDFFSPGPTQPFLPDLGIGNDPEHPFLPPWLRPPAGPPPPPPRWNPY